MLSEMRKTQQDKNCLTSFSGESGGRGQSQGNRSWGRGKGEADQGRMLPVIRGH